MMVSVSLPTYNIKNKNLQIDDKLTISNHKDEIKKVGQIYTDDCGTFFFFLLSSVLSHEILGYIVNSIFSYS